MRTRVFGIADRQPGITVWGNSTERPDMYLSEVVGPLDFDDAQIVIIPANLNLDRGLDDVTQAAELLRRRILEAVEGGVIVCVLTGPDFATRGAFGVELASRLGFDRGDGGELRNADPQFARYLKLYGVQGQPVFTPRNDAVSGATTPLASDARGPSTLAAFAFRIGAGLLYYVPANLIAGSEFPLLIELTDAIERHAPTLLVPTDHPILGSFAFSTEDAISRKRGAVAAELKALDGTLDSQQLRKDILFLRDAPLEARVPSWIEENLGLRTRNTSEGNDEDFWIVDEEGSEVAIGEVKGLTGNVQKKHISALVLHRDEREKPDDFPSLLVVNTFSDARTIDDKVRQRVSPDVCVKAVKSNVLVVRTTDLLFLADQLEQGIVSRDSLPGTLIGAGGWLKVTRNEIELVRS